MVSLWLQELRQLESCTPGRANHAEKVEGETRQSDLLVLYRLSVVRRLTASSFWSTGACKRELEANIFMVTPFNNNNQNICFIPLNCKIAAISLSSQVGLKRIMQQSKKQKEILFYLSYLWMMLWIIFLPASHPAITSVWVQPKPIKPLIWLVLHYDCMRLALRK